MTREAAILLIQRHERARQGRLRAKFMLEIRNQECRERRRRELQDKLGPRTPEAAVVEIQRHVRGMLARKRARVMRLEEMRLIGMEPLPESRKRKSDAITKAHKVEEARYQTQSQYESQYQAALIATKKKILTVEGPDIKEAMADKIREWFMACREQTGKFPDYPTQSQGGSKAIFDPPKTADTSGAEADGQ